MSGIAARIRNGRTSTTAHSPSGTTPRRLLWSVGAAAFVLGIGAFVLWGLNGAATLFDMIAAFCG